MPQVALAYGPPARQGVSTLMAVGDGLQVEPPPLEQAIHKAIWASAAVAAFGFATGNGLLRDAGAGGVVALLLAKFWGKR